MCTYQEERQRSTCIEPAEVVTGLPEENTAQQDGNNRRVLVAAQRQQVQCFQGGRYVGNIKRQIVYDQLKDAVSQRARRLDAKLLGRETVLESCKASR